MDWKNPPSPLPCNTRRDKSYLEVISENEVIFLYEKNEKNYKGVILRTDWCDCNPEEDPDDLMNVYIRNNVIIALPCK